MRSGKDASKRGAARAARRDDAPPPFGPVAPYAQWIAENEPTTADLMQQAAWAAGLAAPLRFSVVTPLYRTPPKLFEATARSVGEQSYGHWEWVVAVADDESRHLRAQVAALAKLDPRVRMVRLRRNEGISAATNAALAEATGDYVAFLDHDDELAPFALFEMARRLQAEPDLDLLYSDEDFLVAEGDARYNLTAKPDWSPETFLGHNYLCHFVAVRRELLATVGGLRPEFDGSQDWDLLLRLSERTKQIGHIASCLYHWRAVPTSCATGAEAKPYAQEAQRRAVTEHFRRRGIEARVETLPTAMQRITWTPAEWPLVSIVIPTRDQAELLRTCVNGLLRETDYPRLEVILVDSGSREPETQELYDELAVEPCVRRIDVAGPFNYSASCNAGARAARGEVLVFLNNDTEVLHDDWLAELVRWAMLPEIGVVGPKLLFPSGRIQHAGMALGLQSLCGHLHYNLTAETPTGYGPAHSYRNVTAVTGACQAMRREVFVRVGGFDERYQIAYSDCALCLRAWQLGLRNLYTPYASLLHHECATRPRSNPPGDAEEFARLVVELGLRRDPYLSPALDVTHPLAPPRAYAAPNGQEMLVRRLEETLFAEVVPQGAEALRHIWRTRPDLRGLFPLGPLPLRHNTYEEWLRRHAHMQFGPLADEAIAAIDAGGDDLAATLTECYLHSRDAQREFPLALTAFSDGRYEDQLRADGALLPAEVRPKTVLDPLAQLRLLGQQSPGVARLLADAAAGEDGQRRLLAWLRGPARQRYALPAAWIAACETALQGGALAQPGVNFIGHLASHSGLGEAARGLLAALETAGVDVAARNAVHPWGVDGLLPLAQFNVDVHDIDLYALQPEGIETVVPHCGVRYRASNYKIGHWTWELEQVPESWHDALDEIDEVWVPSRFVGEAMARATTRPVLRVPYCIERGPIAPVSRAELGVRPDDYVFLFMFDNSSVMERKNPAAVVEAFKQAFGYDDRAALVLKVGRSDYDGFSFAHLKRLAQGHNIRFWTAPLARSRVNGLLAACDCYVSLHRAEGFGLSLAEAMLAGKPVIGTAWSGNMDFMTNENSLPVDYRLVDVPRGLPWYEAGGRWAEVSVEHAANQMRWAFEHRAAAAEIGALASQQIGAAHCRHHVGRIMRRRLEEIGALRTSRPSVAPVAAA